MRRSSDVLAPIAPWPRPFRHEHGYSSDTSRPVDEAALAPPRLPWEPAPAAEPPSPPAQPEQPGVRPPRYWISYFTNADKEPIADTPSEATVRVRDHAGDLRYIAAVAQLPERPRW